MGGYPGGPQRPQWGPQGPGQPPHPGGQHPYQQPPAQRPKKKKRGCGCGCLTFLLILVVVLVPLYLQFWDVWDWMYAIFGVGEPQGVPDSWVWD